MNKREFIINSAVELFLEKGIEKTSVKSIAEKSGIAPGTFYLYFPSKLSVMPVIAERMVNNIYSSAQENLSDNYDLEELLTVLINAIFENTRKYKDLNLLIYSGFTQTKQVNDWETIYQKIYKWLEGCIDHLKDIDRISSRIDSAHLSRIIIGTIESSAEQVYLFAEEKNEEDISGYKASLKQFIYNSL
jgi:AcrR family transcriptional regulator